MAKTPGSGRKPGTPNRRTLEVHARLAQLGCDPIEVLAHIANGDAPCARCQGTGKLTRKRWCPECDGTGRELIDHEQRAAAAKALMPYIAPRRKAVEHSGPGGGPIQQRHSGVLKTPGLLEPEQWDRAAKGGNS